MTIRASATSRLCKSIADSGPDTDSAATTLPAPSRIGAASQARPSASSSSSEP